MRTAGGQRWRQGALLAAPYVLLAGSCAILGAVLGSCDQHQPSLAADPPAQPAEGYTIRVRLTTAPVSSAVLACEGACRLGGAGASPLGPTAVRRRGGRWHWAHRASDAEHLTFEPTGEALVRLDGRAYRGALRLVGAGADAFHVVNAVDLEAYLAGVLSKELYAHWEPAAYRAQAVAARTYALYKLTRGPRGGAYDVLATQGDQVYGGAAAETAKARAAVRATRGWVLAWGPPGRERIFCTYYSACNGGHVNPVEVLTDANNVPPLAGGQPDPDWRHCRRACWGPVRVAKSAVRAALAARHPSVQDWAALRTVRVTERTSYGRPVWVEAVSRGGARLRIRAEALRITLLRAGVAPGLHSMNCRLDDAGASLVFRDGRGFGHGVGLSQWGAQAKARRGASAEDILQFYYPGARIFRAY